MVRSRRSQEGTITRWCTRGCNPTTLRFWEPLRPSTQSSSTRSLQGLTASHSTTSSRWWARLLVTSTRAMPTWPRGRSRREGSYRHSPWCNSKCNKLKYYINNRYHLNRRTTTYRWSWSWATWWPRGRTARVPKDSPIVSTRKSRSIRTLTSTSDYY